MSPRAGPSEERCGEGLIQDGPKFADSRGKTRDDRRTMGCVADDELGLLPIPGVALGLLEQPQTRGWAVSISTIDLGPPFLPAFPPATSSPPSRYAPNGLRIPERRRETGVEGGVRSAGYFCLRLCTACFVIPDIGRFNNRLL